MAWLLRTDGASATYSTSGADAPITTEAGEMYSASTLTRCSATGAVVAHGWSTTEDGTAYPSGAVATHETTGAAVMFSSAGADDALAMPSSSTPRCTSPLEQVPLQELVK